jgi:hypothetical protein
MKTLVASSLALGLLTPAAWAAAPAPNSGKTPVLLAEQQMDQVRAGVKPAYEVTIARVANRPPATKAQVVKDNRVF